MRFSPVFFTLALLTLCTATQLPASGKRQKWKCTDYLYAFVVILAIVAILCGVMVPRIPNQSVLVPHVPPEYQVPQAAGLYVELTSRSVSSELKVDIEHLYPVHRYYRDWDNVRVWESKGMQGRMLVVKELRESVDYQTENEHLAMCWCGENPNRRLRPAKRILHGKASAYVISDLIEGAPVASLGKLETEEVIWLFWEVAHALHHLHEKLHLAHGDLHTSNVMMDVQGNVVLIDFTNLKPARADFVLRDLQTFYFCIVEQAYPYSEELEAVFLAVRPANTASEVIEIIKRMHPKVGDYRPILATKVRSKVSLH